mmetsp:Transcript_42127/g.70174  ORF Transcript_42127/g.70174 Transcript_42127/m.70174 type:complete len:285 (+) Transcript_42127:161-1015(+)
MVSGVKIPMDMSSALEHRISICSSAAGFAYSNLKPKVPQPVTTETISSALKRIPLKENHASLQRLEALLHESGNIDTSIYAGRPSELHKEASSASMANIGRDFSFLSEAKRAFLLEESKPVLPNMLRNSSSSAIDASTKSSSTPTNIYTHSTKPGYGFSDSRSFVSRSSSSSSIHQRMTENLKDNNNKPAASRKHSVPKLGIPSVTKPAKDQSPSSLSIESVHKPKFYSTSDAIDVRSLVSSQQPNQRRRNSTQLQSMLDNSVESASYLLVMADEAKTWALLAS